jgi:hypothetical protein
MQKNVHKNNKNGVKQHILRMHGQKAKKTELVGNIVTVDESSDVLPESGVKETVVNDGPTISQSNYFAPVQSHAQDTNQKSDNENLDFMEVIVNEVIDQCNLVSTNHQCGECGNIFENEEETNKHMADDHTVSGCQRCARYAEDKDDRKTLIKDKDIAISALGVKNENLVKKNESLAKDNRRLNLDLTESIREKNEGKRRYE